MVRPLLAAGLHYCLHYLQIRRLQRQKKGKHALKHALKRRAESRMKGGAASPTAAAQSVGTASVVLEMQQGVGRRAEATPPPAGEDRIVHNPTQ